MDSDLQHLLEEFTNDVESPHTNFNLGLKYEELGNTGSALTHYLKAADRSNDRALEYECLIRISVCLGEQGDRKFSQSHMLKRAIALVPTWPEAYFFLCKFYEADNKIYDCYMLSSVALDVCNFGGFKGDLSCFDQYPNRYNYLGKEGLMLYKALGGMHWEMYDECTRIYEHLLDTSDNQQIRDICENNLKVIRGG